MKHIFYINSLDQLNPKKDSSLMMALTFQEKGIESYVLFEHDFAVSNTGNNLEVFKFSGKFKEDGCYLDNFTVEKSLSLTIDKNVTIHMRIDPPYDSRYQRYLWMLDFLSQSTGCVVTNNPLGIMKYNEKLSAFIRDRNIESFVGGSFKLAKIFIDEQVKKGNVDFIFKPLDLYSGIGVEKVSTTDNLEKIFTKKVKDFNGAIVIQPFIKDVYNGEYRSLYMDGVEVGTIIKKPKEGEYLTNIAQGAKFQAVELPEHLKTECDEIAAGFLKDDVRFIAFDLLDQAVTEINITCPGLLVEVSYAKGENLCKKYASLFNSN